MSSGVCSVARSRDQNLVRVPGPKGEIPPTNRPLNLHFSDLFETDGNRITRHRIYYDQVQFMSQLGLTE